MSRTTATPGYRIPAMTGRAQLGWIAATWLMVAHFVAACATGTPANRAGVESRAAKATQTVPEPSMQLPNDSPVARQFSAWLAALNAADPDQLQRVFAVFLEPRSVERALHFRRMTGGFELMKVLESTPTRLRVWLKERERERMAEAQMEVEAAPPHRVVALQIKPIPTPDAFLSPAERVSRTVDETKRQRLLDKIAGALEAHYVYPEVGEEMIRRLREREASGAYQSTTRAEDLSRTITQDLREISRDLHLRLDFRPEPPPPSHQRPPAERLRQLEEMNFGFGPIQRLSGNVAHLVIRGFVPAESEEARAAIAARMSQVADADALLLDLRDNGGGHPATVARIASYLFDSTPVHLNDMYRRSDDSTREFWTLRDVPGKRFGGKKPIYVLTSKRTFSGGEELAYDMQCLRRGVVIGETTGGGAHPVAPHDLGGGFVMLVPWGRPINPITKTNWERVGVVPDVKLPASAALEEAHKRALRDIAAVRGAS